MKKKTQKTQTIQKKAYKTLSFSLPNAQIDYIAKSARRMKLSKSKFVALILDNWEVMTNGYSNCPHQKINEECTFTKNNCVLSQKDAVNCKFYSNEIQGVVLESPATS